MIYAIFLVLADKTNNKNKACVYTNIKKFIFERVNKQITIFSFISSNWKTLPIFIRFPISCLKSFYSNVYCNEQSEDKEKFKRK